MGGFVTEAKQVLESSSSCRRATTWPGPGSGKTRSAPKRLQMLVPVGIVIIFILLYFTFHSAWKRAWSCFRSPLPCGGTIWYRPATTSRLRSGSASSPSTASPWRPGWSWSSTCTRPSIKSPPGDLMPPFGECVFRRGAVSSSGLC